MTIVAMLVLLSPALLAVGQVDERSGAVVPADSNHDGLLAIYGKRNQVVWEARLHV